MSKFKVGDKVRILDGSKIENYTCGYPEPMRAYTGDIRIISDVIAYADGRFGYHTKGSYWTWDERALELVYETPNWKVVIIPEGDKTIGKLYNGVNLVKEVSTLKSPKDEYSMEEAIKVICERLTMKPEEKEEPPKLYNGKVVCVNADDNLDCYTRGKIYQFVDGYIRCDDGTRMPFTPIHTFEEWEKWSCSKWIEVVEE